MVKNKFRIFIVSLFACIFLLGSSVYAFTISDYTDNQNISIGLESMGSSQLNITLNGDYTFNGVTYKSGTNYILKASESQINFNGVLYSNLSFIPVNTTNTIKIVSNYTTSYRGTLTFKIDYSSGTSKILPVNTLYIEDYLKGVVGKEMSDYFPIEALKAQAVAARSYALANIDKHNTKGYNLCDTTDCQVYGGYDGSLTNVIAAVDATRGKVLLSGTSIVDAFYSASDGGFTEASENVWLIPISYLKAKQDSYDVNYLWNSEYSSTTINTILKLNTSLNIPENYTFVKIDLDSITKFESGRIQNISLIFKDQYGILYTISYGKESARTFLNLQSALYDVSYNAATDIYTFNGKGHGYGVGMSQIGAKNRATAGQSFDTILKFYYDGTTLLNAAINYTVTFNSQGGNAVNSKVANYNDAITTPTEPTKAGYTFGGWYKEAGCLNAWNFITDTITSDTTLYAKWTVVTAPGIPTSLKAVSSSYNSIKISWNGVIGASGYEVCRVLSSAGNYTLIATTTGTSYNNTGLATNSNYYYKVRAYRMIGTVKVYSGFSTLISSKPIPSIPTSVKAVSSSTHSIKISWTGVTGASGYEVCRVLSSAGNYILISRTTATSYNNTGLATNSTYYYKVRAYRIVGTVKVYSGFSTLISSKPI